MLKGLEEMEESVFRQEEGGLLLNVKEVGEKEVGTLLELKKRLEFIKTI